MGIRRVLLKIMILVSVGYAMVCMWHWKIGLTYFTEASNLFVAAAVLVQLPAGRGRAAQASSGRPPGFPEILKYTAVVSVTAAGLAFLFALAPQEPDGFLAAYRQDHYASLCLHVITPVLSVADFLMNDAGWAWSYRHAVWAPVPAVVYFVWILIMGASGFRWYEGMAAPYGFLNYKAPVGWFGFEPGTVDRTTFGIGVFYAVLVLLVIFLLLGAAIVAAARRLSGEGRKG